MKYSPKFANILANITDKSNIGLNLLYSNFRTIEGIGIFKMILEMNGFAEFKLRKQGISWEIIENSNLYYTLELRALKKRKLSEIYIIVVRI